MESGQTFLWVVSLGLSGAQRNTPGAGKDKRPLSLDKLYSTKVLDMQGMLQAAICSGEKSIKWRDTGTLLLRDQ